MTFSLVDAAIFVGFIAFVLTLSIWKGRAGQSKASGESYFLAGRNLSWWVIGISLIAANISTEQFVGMSGAAAGTTGLAVAAYEWISAITLVVVAFFFLPRFVKSRITTIPEFMEKKYGVACRSTVAFFMMMALVLVSNAAVVYSGALFFHKIFDINMVYAVLLIGGIAALYTTYGGLTSVAWADVVQGSALVIGGITVTYLGVQEIGGVSAFMDKGGDKLHMILPANHETLPWTALIGGLWIPAFYYWGLNQYIIQKALAARSLEEGQKGVLMAAFLKLITPLAIVVPGIIAFILYKDKIAMNPDTAYPVLIRELVPVGLKGFIYAAIAGAVVSSLAAMLNSASTIFTLDVYRQYVNKNCNDRQLVAVGRYATIAFVVVACLIAPQLSNPRFGGVFTFIQEFQGYISPGILAAFVFGIFVKNPGQRAGLVGLWANIPIYGVLYFFFPEISFLNRMGITFLLIMILMSVVCMAFGRSTASKENEMEEAHVVSVPRWVGLTGTMIIVLTLLLFVTFK